jgi:hypothetical protein
MALSGLGRAADQNPKIKRLNDPDFLLLLKNSPAVNETLLAHVQAKFYRAVKDSACRGAGNPVVAYLYFANEGDCVMQQLIRLPESTRWELNIWKPEGERKIGVSLVREYIRNSVSQIEEWEISGNGKEYQILKRDNN